MMKVYLSLTCSIKKWVGDDENGKQSYNGLWEEELPILQFYFVEMFMQILRWEKVWWTEQLKIRSFAQLVVMGTDKCLD